MSFKIDTTRRREPRRDRHEPSPGDDARSLDVWKRMAAARHALSTDAAARKQMEQDPDGFLKKYGLNGMPAGIERQRARVEVQEPPAQDAGVGPEPGPELRHVAAVWVAVVAHGAERP